MRSWRVPLMVRPLLVTLILVGVPLTVPGSATVAAERPDRAGNRCTIVGTSGPDRLVGTKRADVICGRGGDDTIIAKGGNDRVVAGQGDDLVRGGSGRDVLIGGSGRDDLSGDRGPDGLRGEGGNDRLDGGPQPDELDGGSGTNTCVLDSDDDASRCVYDLEPAMVVDLQPSTNTVDVTASSKTVTVLARVTDDTGVRQVSVSVSRQGAYAEYSATDASRLVEGTARDGWWKSKITIPQYARAGTYGYTVSTYDVMGRSGTQDDVQDVTLEVQSVEDTELPVLETMTEPSPDTVLDVRSQGASLRVTTRLTDNLSGIDYAFVCAQPVNVYLASLPCASFGLVSGTHLDGIWVAVVPIPQGAWTDQWKLLVSMRDRANPSAHVDYYPSADPWGSPISPAGYGVFAVVGADPPEPPQEPEVSSIELTPTTVDTLSRPATVNGKVTFDDPDGVVTVAELTLQQTRPGGYTEIEYTGQLTKGSDGLWRAPVVLARGAPPGTYQARVIGWDGSGNGHIFYLDAYVTVVDSRT